MCSEKMEWVSQLTSLLVCQRVVGFSNFSVLSGRSHRVDTHTQQVRGRLIHHDEQAPLHPAGLQEDKLTATERMCAITQKTYYAD